MSKFENSTDPSRNERLKGNAIMRAHDDIDDAFQALMSAKRRLKPYKGDQYVAKLMSTIEKALRLI